jgi:hypothetical protein
MRDRNESKEASPSLMSADLGQPAAFTSPAPRLAIRLAGGELADHYFVVVAAGVAAAAFLGRGTTMGPTTWPCWPAPFPCASCR